MEIEMEMGYSIIITIIIIIILHYTTLQTDKPTSNTYFIT